LIKLFKHQRNYGGLYLLILLLLILTSRFGYLFTFGYELSLFSLQFSVLSFVVNFVIIFACGLLVNNIANRYRFFDGLSNLPAALFFCFLAFVPRNQNIDLWLVVLLFSVLVVNKLIKAHGQSRAGRNYFDAAFLLGIIAIIFPVYTVYLAGIIFISLLFSGLHFTNIKLSVIGFLFPWLFWIAVIFVGFPTDWLAMLTDKTKIFDAFALPDIKTIELPISVLVLVAIWVVGTLFWRARKPYLENLQQPILALCSLLCFLGVVLGVLNLENIFFILLFTFCTFSLLFAHVLYYSKKSLASVLFLLFTVYSILYPWIKNITFNL